MIGVRNFSQRGMFFVGWHAGRSVRLPSHLICGCLDRTGGFALLVNSLCAVDHRGCHGLAGCSIPRCGCLAAEAGERKIEAFAMFNDLLPVGILLGPLVGLMCWRWISGSRCWPPPVNLLVSWSLLTYRADSGAKNIDPAGLAGRRCNRPFLTLAAAMTGCYALSFQIYLALPCRRRSSCHATNIS